MGYLLDHIGQPAMLEQTAEECTELAQACLKLARKLRGENPTPKDILDISFNLAEEVADVLICLEELKNISYAADITNNVIDIKTDRIKERFKEAEK